MIHLNVHAVLVYDAFKKKLPEHSVFIAACGAITDYMEDRPIASKLLQIYDRQFALDKRYCFNIQYSRTST